MGCQTSKNLRSVKPKWTIKSIGGPPPQTTLLEFNTLPPLRREEYPITEDQLVRHRTTGAFYSHLNMIWAEQGASNNTSNLNYSLYEPVYVAWHPNSIYRSQRATKSYVAQNIASLVQNDPSVGTYSQYNTTSAVIRYQIILTVTDFVEGHTTAPRPTLTNT